jgi:molybdate transport system substrate-binding protein
MDGVGVDLLDQRGMTRPGSRMPLAESFIGMVVRAGQPKPDISTIEAMRKTLLAAKSIAYSDSSSGTYLSDRRVQEARRRRRDRRQDAQGAGPPSGSRWLRSSPAARRRSVSSRSPS